MGKKSYKRKFLVQRESHAFLRYHFNRVIRAPEFKTGEKKLDFSKSKSKVINF